ncbi:MAG: LytTR family DNA-binding domain-containing protein [Acidobacteriota bacterium]
MTPLRALVVDDEPAARRGLRLLLDREPGVEVVGESGDGDAALADIEALGPDLVFLDVQMPGKNGFEVLADVPPERRPHVIFVTAHDHYALEAFRVHALDYLLKPFSDGRFREALAHAREQLYGRDMGAIRDRLEAFLNRVSRRVVDRRRPDRLAVKTGERVLLIDPARIRWIEAKQDYAELHTADGTYLIRRTMRELEDELDPARFFRIHRSTLVNLREIVELRPLFRGDYDVLLRDGSALRLSRRRREALARALGQAI